MPRRGPRRRPVESAGGVRELNERYDDDAAFRAAVDAAHAEAAANRERLEPGAGGWGGVAGRAGA